MQVMSSITVSFSFHFQAAALTIAFPACSGEFFTKYGQTIFAIASFERNSQTPSLAIIINLSLESKVSYLTSTHNIITKIISYLVHCSLQEYGRVHLQDYVTSQDLVYLHFSSTLYQVLTIDPMAPKSVQLYHRYFPLFSSHLEGQVYDLHLME